MLMGPEQPISVLSEQMDGISWDATGVGFGVRGSNRTDLTLRLEGRSSKAISCSHSTSGKC